MATKDDSFNLDDVMEIFGDQKKAAPVSARPTNPAPAAPPREPAEPLLSEEEMRMLAEYENKKKERKQREEEERRRKEAEERRILEEYERHKNEAREREERERKAAEEKQRAELEALKQRQLREEMLRQEEQRIIDDYEREQAARAQREKLEGEAREARAQQALQDLKKSQAAAAQKRQEEEQAEALQAEQAIHQAAQAGGGEDKQKRLLQLLGKVQQDLFTAEKPVLPPLDSANAPKAAAIPEPETEPEPAGEFEMPFAGGPREPLPEDIDSGFNDGFSYIFEEGRKACFGYLAPVIGIKAANAMLNKTVEKARAKEPAMLKDVNWRMDGTLREDGSMDVERLFKNAQGIPAAERTERYFKAHREIMVLRVQAVEMGLGRKARREMLERLAGLKERVFEPQGVPTRWQRLYYQEVF